MNTENIDAEIKLTYNDSIQREIDEMDKYAEEIGYRSISDTSRNIAIEWIKKKYIRDTVTDKMRGEVLWINIVD